MLRESTKKNPNVVNMVIDMLTQYHKYWYEHDREKSQFNYYYIRNKDQQLMGAIERKSNGIMGLQNAFELAGINPFCHMKKVVLYGKNKDPEILKKRFIKVLYYLLIELESPQQLNDNTMNSNSIFIPPKSLQGEGFYPVCNEYDCKIIPITFMSIYSEGCRLFGNWQSAIEAAGLDYERICRKKPKYPRDEVMQDFMIFVRKRDGHFGSKEIKEQDNSLYMGIYNTHPESPFGFADLSPTETAYIEIEYLIRKQLEPSLTPEEFYKQKGKKIKD